MGKITDKISDLLVIIVYIQPLKQRRWTLKCKQQRKHQGKKIKWTLANVAPQFQCYLKDFVIWSQRTGTVSRSERRNILFLITSTEVKLNLSLGTRSRFWVSVSVKDIDRKLVQCALIQRRRCIDPKQPVNINQDWNADVQAAGTRLLLPSHDAFTPHWISELARRMAAVSEGDTLSVDERFCCSTVLPVSFAV